jgi:hypothetical protein
MRFDVLIPGGVVRDFLCQFFRGDSLGAIGLQQHVPTNRNRRTNPYHHPLHHAFDQARLGGIGEAAIGGLRRETLGLSRLAGGGS